jgi:hypothetical protein
MANNALLTPSLITKETLVILQNNLVMAGKVNRKFENQFTKIGSTLTIRKPNKFVAVNGPALSLQDIQEPSTSITISNQTHVDFQFTQQDLTLTIEEFSERYLKPAAETLANAIDAGVMANYSAIQNLVGTPGTVPAAYSAIAAVGQRMDAGAVPQDGRVLVLNEAAYWSLDAAFIGLYVKSVAEPALKGFLANIANFEIYMDQNAPTRTVGAYAGTPVVNGAGQTGSSLVTSGWTGSITGLLNVGDVFTIAGVYAINPQSRVAKSFLQNFVVTATANSTAGAATISIYPAITTTGPYQTVSASPANNAAITVISGAASTSYQENLGFVKDAFGLVVVPMELPSGVDFAAREMVKNLSMTVVRAYDINSTNFPCRMDILWGTATYYPELAVRLTN